MTRAFTISRVVLLALLAATASVTAQSQGTATGDSELDRQTRAVASQLKCMACQGISIEDSPATLAQEMRGVVRDQLAAGRTPEQVKQYFVERYGEHVLMQPRASGFNLVVYVLPVIVLLGGATFVLLKARQWVRRSEGGHSVHAQDEVTDR